MQSKLGHHAVEKDPTSMCHNLNEKNNHPPQHSHTHLPMKNSALSKSKSENVHNVARINYPRHRHQLRRSRYNRPKTDGFENLAEQSWFCSQVVLPTYSWVVSAELSWLFEFAIVDWVAAASTAIVICEVNSEYLSYHHHKLGTTNSGTTGLTVLRFGPIFGH